MLVSAFNSFTAIVPSKRRSRRASPVRCHRKRLQRVHAGKQFLEVLAPPLSRCMTWSTSQCPSICSLQPRFSNWMGSPQKWQCPWVLSKMLRNSRSLIETPSSDQSLLPTRPSCRDRKTGPPCLSSMWQAGLRGRGGVGPQHVSAKHPRRWGVPRIHP